MVDVAAGLTFVTTGFPSASRLIWTGGAGAAFLTAAVFFVVFFLVVVRVVRVTVVPLMEPAGIDDDVVPPVFTGRGSITALLMVGEPEVPVVSAVASPYERDPLATDPFVAMDPSAEVTIWAFPVAPATGVPLTVEDPWVTTVGLEAYCPGVDFVDAATGVPTPLLKTGAEEVVMVPVPSPATKGCALVLPCTLTLVEELVLDVLPPGSTDSVIPAPEFSVTLGLTVDGTDDETPVVVEVAVEPELDRFEAPPRLAGVTTLVVVGKEAELAEMLLAAEPEEGIFFP